MALANLLEVIGVPMDLGANTRGANMGPAAIRVAGLHQRIKNIGYQVRDHGDLEVPVRETLNALQEQNKNLSVIENICNNLAKKTYDSLKNSHTPLILGGDHSLSIGSVSGISRFCQEENKELGLIWFDAHADMNTPQSSPSGNIHGMPLSTLLADGYPQLTHVAFKGSKVKASRSCLIGIRSVDELEKEYCKKSSIHYFTMRDIDERGIKDIMAEAIKITSEGTRGIHLSFDLDVLDPQYAPGVSTPVSGGLSDREAHLALELLADSKKLLSMDMVELNPINDIEQKTAILACELIQSALGKSILV